MDKLEQVEALVAKCGVSYADAKEALEASDYDMLDAIIYLERAGKAGGTAHVYTEAGQAANAAGPSSEMIEAQAAYEESAKKSKFAERMESVWEYVKRIAKRGMDMSFVVDRHGDRVVSIPLLITILAIFIWWFVLPLLVAGLFFGFRYRIDGIGPVTVDINDAMGHASEAAESIRADFAHDNDEEPEIEDPDVFDPFA